MEFKVQKLFFLAILFVLLKGSHGFADNGKAFVDLNPGQGISQSMDTGTEGLAVYSVVSSLAINNPGIKMVKH